MPNWLLTAQPAPKLLVLPPAAVSLDEAHAAIDLWEFYSGKTLDPTQRLAVEIMMAVREDGSWAAKTTGREMPRQNGKGDEIEVPEFWGLIKLNEAIAHTIHDAVLLASQAQERMLSLFDHRDLRHLIEGGTVWKGTGQQMIKLSTGGQIWYRTRTGGGLRGVDKLDRLVVDEAQHATDEQLRAMTSTLMAAPDPQMNTLGTAALEGKSSWWWGVRKRALSATPGDFGYIGHTAEDVSMTSDGKVVQSVPDLMDRELWKLCNPATFYGRGQGMSFLEEELWRLGSIGFAQEHLCVWAPEPDSVGGPVSLDRWNSLIDGESTSLDDPVRLCLDAPPDRMSADFTLAGKRSDNLRHVEVRDHIDPTRMPSLVARAKELADGHKTSLIIPPGSPAESWADELEAAGVPLDRMKPSEYAAACGYIMAAVQEGNLRHRGQPELTNAVAGLATRNSGDVEVWARRSSAVNIAPFVGVTCALARLPIPTVKTVEPWVMMR